MIKEHGAHILLPAMDDPIYPRSKLPGPKILDKPSCTYNNMLPSSIPQQLNSEGISWLPPKFLESVTPLFIIRHPTLLIPSYIRAHLEVGEKGISEDQVRLAANFKPIRTLVDMYTTKLGEKPIIVDGDDLVNDAKRVCSEICTRLGLDPGLLKYEWEKRQLGTEEMTWLPI